MVINTGAKLPDTANAVIQIEDTQVQERHDAKNGGGEKSIRITTECAMNQDIRYASAESHMTFNWMFVLFCF